MLNRATQGLYPPGSTFKMIVAATAIENNLADFTYDCTGEIVVDGSKIRCSGQKAHGTTTLETALVQSCNTYFGRLVLS